jgi:hypothetical protein
MPNRWRSVIMELIAAWALATKVDRLPAPPPAEAVTGVTPALIVSSGMPHWTLGQHDQLTKP